MRIAAILFLTLYLQLGFSSDTSLIDVLSSLSKKDLPNYTVRSIKYDMDGNTVSRDVLADANNNKIIYLLPGLVGISNTDTVTPLLFTDGYSDGYFGLRFKVGYLEEYLSQKINLEKQIGELNVNKINKLEWLVCTLKSFQDENTKLYYDVSVGEELHISMKVDSNVHLRSLLSHDSNHLAGALSCEFSIADRKYGVGTAFSSVSCTSDHRTPITYSGVDPCRMPFGASARLRRNCNEIIDRRFSRLVESLNISDVDRLLLIEESMFNSCIRKNIRR